MASRTDALKGLRIFSDLAEAKWNVLGDRDACRNDPDVWEDNLTVCTNAGNIASQWYTILNTLESK